MAVTPQHHLFGRGATASVPGLAQFIAVQGEPHVTLSDRLMFHHHVVGLTVHLPPAQQAGRAMQAPRPQALPDVSPGALSPVLEGQELLRRHGGQRPGALQRRDIEQRGVLALDQRRVEIGGGKSLGLHQAAQKGHVGVQAQDLGLPQGLRQPGQGLGAVLAPDDELGDHGVVVGTDLVALTKPGVQARQVVSGGEAHMLGPASHPQPTGGGQELGIGVFCTQARLDGMAAPRYLVLAQRQRPACGHLQLPVHQIQACDGLGHWVLHLQAGVHLHEIKAQIAVGRGLSDEFHRARAHIAHRLGGSDGGRAHLGPTLVAQARRRRLFQHLLMSALHRAVTLEQMHALPVLVSEDLNLDVAGARDVALDQHMVVAKAGASLALASRQGRREVFRAFHPAHAFAAATGARLDEHRVAHGIGLRLQEGRVVVVPVVTGHQGHPRAGHQGLGGGFAAHGRDGAGRRADEDHACLGTGLGKGFVLRQKPIARVDGLCPSGLGGGQDALPAQVALGRRGRAQVDGFVAGLHMPSSGIGIGIHRHRGDAQLAGGGRHPASDLAAVGNQNLLEHRHPLTCETVRSAGLRGWGR